MICAELKKLLHNGTFRVFLCIALLAGAVNPLLARFSPDDSGNRPAHYAAAFAAYAGQTPEAVIEGTAHQIELLRAAQDYELLAQLPAEMAQVHLEYILSEYDLTEEEMQSLNTGSLLRFGEDAYAEAALLEAVQKQAARAAEYPAYLDSIGQQEQTIRNSSLYRDNAYALHLAQVTAEAYTGLAKQPLPLADPTAVEAALGNWVDDVIGCAIACLAALFAFLQERQEGMTALLFSTRRGRRATYTAKLTLVTLFGGASCLALTALRLGLAGDLGDLSRPVQTIPAFYTSPWPISVGAMLVLSALQRTAATVLVGVLMSLVCIALDRALALGTAALAAGVQVLCWRAIDSASWLQPLKYCSIPALFSEETLLGNAVYVKLFGTPAAYGWVFFLLLVPGGALAAWLGSRLYARSHRALAIPARVRSQREKKVSPGLFRLEFGKLLLHQRCAILLLLVIALQPWFYNSFRSHLTADELRYLSVLQPIQGDYSEETHASLLAQRQELADLESAAQGLASQDLQDRIAALDRVLLLSDYLSTRTEPVCYVYETGYEALFGVHPIGVRYQPWLMGLAPCLMLPGLFTLERETGMDRLCRTTAGLRRVNRVRVRIALLLTVVVFAVCWLPEVWFIHKTFLLAEPTAPAVSLQMLSALPGWVPLWLAAVGLWLGRLGAALGAGALVCIVAKKTGKYLPAALLSGGILLAIGLIF